MFFSLQVSYSLSSLVSSLSQSFNDDLSIFSDHSQKSGRYLGKKKSNNIILTVLRLDKVSNSKSDFISCVIKENTSYRYAEKFRLLQLVAPHSLPQKN